MQYNFVILRTGGGKQFARKILRSIKWINEHKYPQHEFIATNLTISEFLAMNNNTWQLFGDVHKENTIIHTRAANPRTDWTIKLRELEELGYKVVNSVDTIELTSNKLACSLHLQDKVNHPKTWEWDKNSNIDVKDKTIDAILDFLNNQPEDENEPQYFIAKPYTSLEQGANVRKISAMKFWDFGASFYRKDEILDEIEKVPGNKIVIQEYIPYIALHRVIVIGGKALPYTFVDYADDPRKTDWKVSCCLNRTTMQLNEDADPRLLELAEITQKEVGGIINFIDIFEYGQDWDPFGGIRAMYTIAEINTACNLSIHEKLARNAGRRDWNIHYRIAKELVKQLGV